VGECASDHVCMLRNPKRVERCRNHAVVKPFY
jgi:hypothetical protein